MGHGVLCLRLRKCSLCKGLSVRAEVQRFGIRTQVPVLRIVLSHRNCIGALSRERHFDPSGGVFMNLGSRACGLLQRSRVWEP